MVKQGNWRNTIERIVSGVNVNLGLSSDSVIVEFCSYVVVGIWVISVLVGSKVNSFPISTSSDFVRVALLSCVVVGTWVIVALVGSRVNLSLILRFSENVNNLIFGVDHIVFRLR